MAPLKSLWIQMMTSTTLRGTLLLQLSSPTLPILSCIFPSLHSNVTRWVIWDLRELLLPARVPIVRNSFPVCGNFLDSYFAWKLDHGLHWKWIFRFAFFWGRLSKAITKEKCVRSLSLRSLLLSSCIDLQSILITCGFGMLASQQEFVWEWLVRVVNRKSAGQRP